MIIARRVPLLPKRIESSSKLLTFHEEKFKLPVLFAISHIPLGLLLYSSSTLALLYPIITLLFGLYFAVRRSEKIQRSAYVAAYLIGVEVLWRMAKSPVFWEFGKYGAAAILIVALVRRNHWKLPLFPLLYLIFLVPSCLSTVMFDNSLSEAKDKLSFNMSGPFLLLVCCWFFSQATLQMFEVKKLLIMIVIPLIAVAFTTLFITVSNENISFGTESNFATSGGFGPNQVSSMLGLGVFVCLAACILFRNKLGDTIYLGFLALFFSAQSVLTFSRGGMYNAVGALGLLILFYLKSSAQNLIKLLPVLGLALLFLAIVFPYLNDFTGGALQARFEDTDTTGRTEIIEADYQIFLENPVFGAGVGEARDLREAYFGEAVGAHTEFARVISEHGLFGIAGLIILGLGTVFEIRRKKSALVKSLAVGAVMWSCLFMMNAGMRLAAPSFIWGLTYLVIVTPKRLYLPKKTI